MINNCCQLSPLLFIINIILGFYYEYFLYGLLFFCLMITSFIYHTYYTVFSNIIDKVSILYVVLYGCMLFNQKLHFVDKNIKNIIMLTLIVLTFLSTFYLYYYGYYTKNYCFNENIVIANLYQSLIHLISCFSHSLIMLV
jgi:hypothetical protein